MLIIRAFTDIHGRNIPQELVKDVDLVILVGDITNFGTRKDAEKIIDPLLKEGVKVLAIPGNCDKFDVNTYLEEKKVSIFGRTAQIEGVIFGGIGGGNISPFSTPQEYTEEEISKFLQKIENEFKNKELLRILVTHTPPYNTKTDKVFLGKHVGSKVIREFIELYQPNVVLTGHIHESRGEDRINNSIVLNPGPGPKRYVELHIESKKIQYKIV